MPLLKKSGKIGMNYADINDMSTEAELKARLDELEKANKKLEEQTVTLSEQNKSLLVSTVMAKRRKDAEGLFTSLGLSKETKANIEFSEPGEEPKTAEVGWDNFLVGLDEESFKSFVGLTEGLKLVKAGDSDEGSDDDVLFSEFDTDASVEPLNFSEGRGKDMKEALAAARKAYATGKSMA